MAITTSLIALTNGAALGTSPGAIGTASAADDQAGAITMTSGTTPAAGTLCTFYLGTSYNDNSSRGAPVIVVSGGNAASGGLGLSATYSTVTQQVTISCATAPAASTALVVNYHVDT